MINEKVRDLMHYAGNKCDYSDKTINWSDSPLSLAILNEIDYRISVDDDFCLIVYLKSLESLTREICHKMWGELNTHQHMDEETKDFMFDVMIKGGEPSWREVFWLQNEGYYMVEDSIKEYIRLDG